MIADGAYGTFEGDATDRVVFGAYQREGSWSPELVALLVQLLGGGASFVDVGAHIGLVAIPVTERSDCRCLAIEPEPRNFALLERNIERHGLGEHITALHCAAHSAHASVRLALSRDNSGDHHLLPMGMASPRATIEVPARRLDDLLAAHPLPGPLVLKLDTQGAEAQVLRGAPRALANASHVLLEYWPAGLRRQGDDAEALATILRELPYGAVLGPDFDATLAPSARMLQSLAWIPTDGSDEGFFDLLLSREPTLPSGTRS
jgi:FkbM family methyltransferase